MKINDLRKSDVKVTINDCNMGDVVELDGLDGVFVVTDRFNNDTCLVVRLSDGFTFDVKNISVAHIIKYEFVIMD